MSTKAAATDDASDEAKYRAGIEELLAEFSVIRREMKKTDAEIHRLEKSTRRKLDRIQANLHVENAA